MTAPEPPKRRPTFERGLVVGSLAAAALTREVGSANEALALADHELPEILVSDIGMPDMSGLDLIREVRHLGAAP